jgi:ElaB/YqjD/DUF883 family membrane-anchored ribosome-binding protein
VHQADEEMFDDLHSGVEALRRATENTAIPLTQKAVQSIIRLEANMPVARSNFKRWKERAVKVAKSTDKVAHANPWTFTLGALGLGIVAGLLLLDGKEKED